MDDSSPSQLELEEAGQVLMSALRQTFPGFDKYWAMHVAPWGEDLDLPYINISHFARFIDRALLPTPNIPEVQEALLLLDKLFLTGDEATQDLIGIGFIEDLQNFLSGRAGEYSTVVALLPQTLLKVWQQIEKQWAGKSSLMEVIESERAQPAIQKTWAQILNLPEASAK